SIPSTTSTELQRLNPKRISVLGGEAVISPAVFQSLKAYAADVSRIGGTDRYDTAARISKAGFSPGVAKVYVATATNFPDALAAAPAAGLTPGPLLLVPGTCVPDHVANELKGYDHMVMLGGPSAVSNDVPAMKPCPPPGLPVPAEAPRATISADVSFSGTGRGWAAYLGLHDAHGN